MKSRVLKVRQGRPAETGSAQIIDSSADTSDATDGRASEPDLWQRLDPVSLDEVRQLLPYAIAGSWWDDIS
jgi:hypothetical protein